MIKIHLTLLLSFFSLYAVAQVSGNWNTGFQMPGISQGDISAMVSDDNYLYILNSSWAGEFGGDPSKKQFVRWDGQQYEQLGSLFKCTSCGLGYLETMIMGEDGKIYIGGYFEGAYNPDGSYVKSDHLIRWNIANEQWESISNGIEAFRISALEIIGDTLYVAGTGFYSVIQPNADVLDVYNIAAMSLSTGEWSDMDGGVEYEYNTRAQVYAIEKNGQGELFVGGLINMYDAKDDSVRFASVVKWDPASGWQGAAGLYYYPWEGGSANPSTVHSLYYDAITDRMFAGGYFGINQGSRGFAAYDGASWEIIGGIGQSGYQSFFVNEIQGDPGRNVLYVGGTFNYEDASVSTVGNGVGIFNLDSDTWEIEPMNGGLNGRVINIQSIQSFRNKVYVGGQFEGAGNLLANNLAAWDGNQWDALGKGIHTNNSLIFDAVEWNGKMIAGGYFEGFASSAAKSLAVFDPQTNEWSELGGGLQNGVYNAIVYSLHLDGDQLYVGGYFNRAGEIDASGLARYDLNTGEWTNFGTGASNSNGPTRIRDIEIYQGFPVVVGYFDEMDGVTARSMAWYNGTTWEALGDPGIAEIQAVFNNGDSALYVGGNFSSVNGNTTIRSIGKYSNGSWHAMGRGISGQVWDIDKDPGNGNILVGGNFVNLIEEDGAITKASGMASWNGENWLPTADIVQNTSGRGREILTIEVMDDSLVFVGGQFDEIDNQPILNIAVYDGCSFWSIGGGIDGVPGGSLTTHTEVNGIVKIGDELFVAGGFTKGGDNTSYGIASFTYSSLPKVCDPNQIGLPDYTYSCLGDTEILVVPPFFTNYVWSTGSTNDSISVTTEGTYYITVENDQGQLFTDSTSVLFEEPAIFSLGNDTTLIGGLSLSAPTGVGYTYQWSTSDTIARINIYNSGSYTVELITQGGCKSSDDIDVTITALPEYSGGFGDGYAQAKYANTQLLSIYAGGNGDGYSNDIFNNVKTFSIYQGGVGDGFDLEIYTNAGSFDIYTGGNGDGYARQGFINMETFEIYAGGDGDGYSESLLVNSNIFSIYGGGDGDGYSESLLANFSTFNIYSGGTSDGYATAEYLNSKTINAVKNANLFSDMKLYPNPVSFGPLNIDLPFSPEDGVLKFIGINGNTQHEILIKNRQSIELQLEGILMPGVYVVLFKDAGVEKIYESKIIVHY